MIRWVAQALGLNTLVVWALVALVWALVALIGVGSIYGYGWTRYRTGIADGKAAEALIWTKKMADLRLKLESDRKAAQAAIDDIERKYHEQRQLAEALDEELELAIHELEAGGNAGKPALSRRLSNVLDKIGR